MIFHCPNQLIEKIGDLSPFVKISRFLPIFPPPINLHKISCRQSPIHNISVIYCRYIPTFSSVFSVSTFQDPFVYKKPHLFQIIKCMSKYQNLIERMIDATFNENSFCNPLMHSILLYSSENLDVGPSKNIQLSHSPYHFINLYLALNPRLYHLEALNCA